MLPFILRRLAWALVLILAITMVSYAMFFLVPTAPGAEVRGQARETTNIRESVRVQGPVYKEYGTFLWRITHFQFGESWNTERSVNEVLLQAAPVTLSLVLGAAVMWMLIAIPIGIISALRPRSLLDRLMTVPVLIGIAAHPIWLGLILLYFLSHKAQLFPVGGYCDLTGPDYVCNGFVQWTWHLILPWLTFALLYAAFYARMIRASIVETMNEDYVRTARAKGASGAQVMKRHVLRNAMLPVVTMLGMDLGLWMGNAIFIESIFGMPGIGRLLTTSLGRRDLPVMMAIIIFVSVLIVLLNLIVDLIYPLIDPRVRTGRGGWRFGRVGSTRQTGVVVSSAEQPAQT